MAVRKKQKEYGVKNVPLVKEISSGSNRPSYTQSFEAGNSYQSNKGGITPPIPGSPFKIRKPNRNNRRYGC